MGAEQSNTSVVLDDRLVLKLYRKLEAGVNPELELLRFLTERDFPAIASLQGWAVHVGQPLDATLAILQDFVPVRDDGWALALKDLEAGGDGFVGLVRRLGEVTGAMHSVLASDAADPAFAPEEPSGEALALIVARIDEEIEQVFNSLPDEPALEPIAGRGDDLRGRLQEIGQSGSLGRLIRHHGDYHLGQVLWTENEDWVVLDFEGEPARPLRERRHKRSPLRDVAGMLRSFSYAASASELEYGVEPPPGWEGQVRSEFLAGYLAKVDPALVPADPSLERGCGCSSSRRRSTNCTTSSATARTGCASRSPESSNSWTSRHEGLGTHRHTLVTPQPWPFRPRPGTVPRRGPKGHGGKRHGVNEVEQLVAGRLTDPHHLLGAHPHDGGVVVRAWRPEAQAVVAKPENAPPVELELRHPAGLFEGVVPDADAPLSYELEVSYPDGNTFTLRDPYAFPPTLGELDLHLAGEGRHERIYERLGAHLRDAEGVTGTAFAVWAPNAAAVSVVGDFNGWDGRLNPMRSLGASGIWELFVPGLGEGERYKYELKGPQGELLPLKADPYALAAEVPPATASRVYRSRHEWRDDDWLDRRRAHDPLREPVSIYEVHLESWRRNPLEANRALSYLELADELAEYATDLGFTHVELLPVMHHPFPGSWGYQVTGYFAPTRASASPTT
jgi:hypothetical protein